MSSIYWFHSIDLGDRVTPGQKPAELLAQEWDQMRLPPLAGKSVLDIGVWDGYFSFRAEDAGAAQRRRARPLRVVVAARGAAGLLPRM